jgi:hypothetical protein
MFLIHVPQGSSAKQAFDAAMEKRASFDRRGCRDQMEHLLRQHIADDGAYGAVMDEIDQILGLGEKEDFRSDKVYGDEEEAEEVEQREERHGFDEEGEIPRNAHEIGMGGATKTYGDRRRAHDSRRVAMDAQDTFEQFYGAGRIKTSPF